MPVAGAKLNLVNAPIAANLVPAIGGLAVQAPDKQALKHPRDIYPANWFGGRGILNGFVLDTAATTGMRLPQDYIWLVCMDRLPNPGDEELIGNVWAIAVARKDGSKLYPDSVWWDWASLDHPEQLEIMQVIRNFHRSVGWETENVPGGFFPARIPLPIPGPTKPRQQWTDMERYHAGSHLVWGATDDTLGDWESYGPPDGKTEWIWGVPVTLRVKSTAANPVLDPLAGNAYVCCVSPYSRLGFVLGPQNTQQANIIKTSLAFQRVMDALGTIARVLVDIFTAKWGDIPTAIKDEIEMWMDFQNHYEQPGKDLLGGGKPGPGAIPGLTGGTIGGPKGSAPRDSLPTDREAFPQGNNAPPVNVNGQEGPTNPDPTQEPAVTRVPRKKTDATGMFFVAAIILLLVFATQES